MPNHSTPLLIRSFHPLCGDFRHDIRVVLGNIIQVVCNRTTHILFVIIFEPGRRSTTGDGSLINAGNLIAQGNRGRVPSDTSLLTC